MSNPTSINPCASASIYDSLLFCKGKTVLPGLRNKAWGVPKSQIQTFAQLPDITEALEMAKAAVLAGDFELFADAKWLRIDLLDTASNVVSASQGEHPSKTFLNTLTIKYAGNNEAAAGFCRMANTDDWIFIVQQRDGKFRVVGNDMFDTNINPTMESGMAVTDASGTTLEITSTDICPAPFYEGLLDTVDGWLNCKTGEITAEKPVAA